MLDPVNTPTLVQAHGWTTKTLQTMQGLLDPLRETAPDVTMVAASGSLGRLEALSHSDCDLIVLVGNEAAADSARCEKAMQAVWQVLEPLGLRLPKSYGIYATPASHEQICDYSTLGQIADDRDIFGKRMQVLLDAKPVYGQHAFRQLQRGLLERYADGFLIYDQRREWVYLLNDLLRYFRSYCGWHQFDLSHEAIDNWYMRNAKLRNSRIPMFAALIFLLGECSKEKKDKIGWLEKHLEMTVLERLQFVYEQNNDDNFPVLLRAYEYYLAEMAKEPVRKKLLGTIPASLEELHNTSLPEYEILHENSKTILSELTRFTLARYGQWSEAFFEYLLF